MNAVTLRLIFDSKEETDGWIVSQYPARQMNHPCTNWTEMMETEQRQNPMTCYEFMGHRRL